MLSPEKVSVFWDYDRCSVPTTDATAFDAVRKIRALAHRFGSVVSVKAYVHSEKENITTRLRSELLSAGVGLTNCQNVENLAGADNMILVDMFAFALDNPAPSTVVLISDSNDLAYAASTLGFRKHKVVLVSPTTIDSHLRSTAAQVFEWRDIMDKSPSIPTALPGLRPLSVRKSIPERELYGPPIYPSENPGPWRLTSIPFTPSPAKREFDVRVNHGLPSPTRSKDAATISKTNTPTVNGVKSYAPAIGSLDFPVTPFTGIRNSSSSDHSLSERPAPSQSRMEIHPGADVLVPVVSNGAVTFVPAPSPVPQQKEDQFLQTALSARTQFTQQLPSPRSRLVSAEETPSVNVPVDDSRRRVSAGNMAPRHTEASPSSTIEVKEGSSSTSISDKPLISYIPWVRPPPPTSEYKAPVVVAVVEEDKARSKHVLSPEAPVWQPKRVSQAKRKGIPTQYTLLAKCMRKLLENGQAQPLLSTLEEELGNRGIVYLPADRKGFSSFEQYAAGAEEAGVITIGGAGEERWAVLQMMAGSSPQPSSSRNEGVASEWKPLIDHLNMRRANGEIKPLRSSVSDQLRLDNSVYKRVGVKKWGEYAIKAKEAGVVQLGGSDGTSWVTLTPNYRVDAPKRGSK